MQKVNTIFEDAALNRFITSVVEWCAKSDNIVGLAVVGSYARGDASDTSDVDLVLLATDKDKLLNNSEWLDTFAVVKAAEIRDYGKLISIHTEYKQLPEIEFGICDVSWADVPLDSGTKEVILGGMKVLYDANHLLERAVLNSYEIDGCS